MHIRSREREREGDSLVPRLFPKEPGCEARLEGEGVREREDRERRRGSRKRERDREGESLITV